MARGCFDPRSHSLDRRVSIHSQSHCFCRLLFRRPAVLPRAHTTNGAALVRLHGAGGLGGFAGRCGCDFKFPNWPDGKRRACRIPGHLHQNHGHFASAGRRTRHSGCAGERCSRPSGLCCGIASFASCGCTARLRSSPRHRPQCLGRLECPCLCAKAPPRARLNTSPKSI